MKKTDIIIGLIALIVSLILTYYIYEKYSDQEIDKLITKDMLFLCPSKNNEGEIVFVKKDAKLYEKEVCQGESLGSYTCLNDYCLAYEDDKLNSYYVNYQKGIALISDNNLKNSKQAFLYNFKDERKISDEYDFLKTLFKDNDKLYFLIVDKSGNSGIIDNQGRIIFNNIYKQIGITPYEKGISGQFDSKIVAIRNNKFGILDIKTGREITNFEFDKVGFIKVTEPNNYSLDSISRHNTSLINELGYMYVEADGKGKIINIINGETIKELPKTYVSVYPISDNLMLIEEENNLIDIVDYDYNSFLEDKLVLDGYVTYIVNDNKLYIGKTNLESSNSKEYIFDIITKKLINN